MTKSAIETILTLICNYPAAQKEIRAIRDDKNLQVERINFGLAYGVTPTLFVHIKTFGDSYTDRVRLMEPERGTNEHQ